MTALSGGVPPALPPRELEEVQHRWAKGLAWVSAHDPSGAFYLWLKSGLTPASAMPGVTPERQAEWREWYKAYHLFMALDTKLLGLESQLPATGGPG